MGKLTPLDEDRVKKTFTNNFFVLISSPFFSRPVGCAAVIQVLSLTWKASSRVFLGRLLIWKLGRNGCNLLLIAACHRSAGPQLLQKLPGNFYSNGLFIGMFKKMTILTAELFLGLRSWVHFQKL